MANTFNISVAPEITALEAKIDIVDTVVDLIRGTDVVNLSSGIAANNTILADLHDTDIPAIDTKLTIIDTVVDNIRNIDVSNIRTEIGANNTILADLHDTDIPAINTLVSSLPHNNKASLKVREYNCTSATYVDALNITDAGRLYLIRSTAVVAADLTIRITIDGIVSNEFSEATEAEKWYTIDNTTGGILVLDCSDTLALINFDFHTSLRIEVKDASTDSWINIIYGTV